MMKYEMTIALLALCPIQAFAGFVDENNLEVKAGDRVYFMRDYGKLVVKKAGEFVEIQNSRPDGFGGGSATADRTVLDPGKILKVGGPLLPQDGESKWYLQIYPNATVTGMGDYFEVGVKRFGHLSTITSVSNQGPKLTGIYRSVDTYGNFKRKQKVTCEHNGQRVKGKISELFSNGIAKVTDWFSKSLIDVKDCSSDS